MEVCQLLLESSRQRHVFELCQNDLFFLERRLARCIRDASREDTTEAARILFGAENETEAGKAEDQINTGSDVACKRPQPIASVGIIGAHSGLCKRVVRIATHDEMYVRAGGVQSMPMRGEYE